MEYVLPQRQLHATIIGAPVHYVNSGIRGFFSRHGSTIGLAVLIGYVILLGIGVIAEMFWIQWILD